MDKTQYNTCMKKYITGSKSKEQRIRDFCIGAKICSGKAKDEAEATKLCAEAALNPKPITRKRKSNIDSGALAACVIRSFDGTEITLAKLTTIIDTCNGRKPLTREKFIKKCFRENQVTGDIKEAQKLRSLCTARWKEQESSNV